MDNMRAIEELLIRHEGIRFKPYTDTVGKLSVGVGRNLDDKGISKEEAMYLLRNDIDESARDLANLIFNGRFYEFPVPVQHVLISMRFQLGRAGFRKFKKMIFAFQELDYEEAIVQMKASKWYGQVTKRADELIDMIRKAI